MIAIYEKKIRPLIYISIFPISLHYRKYFSFLKIKSNRRLDLMINQADNPAIGTDDIGLGYITLPLISQWLLTIKLLIFYPLWLILWIKSVSWKYS